MRLRTALNEYKRRRDEPFPGTQPTDRGAFSGVGDRLVHVDRDGSFRDYSAPLSGLAGVDRSRFGIETEDGIDWFDDIEPVRQHYYDDTTLVETEYDAGAFTVHQYDLTLGRAHVSHVELRGRIPADAHLTAFLTFAPEHRETQVGRLIHEGAGPDGGKVVEAFHREEHDYVAASTGIDRVRGQVPERFHEILDEDPVEFPRRVAHERYEDAHLSGDFVVSAPLERAGRGARATLVTQISDHTETTREQAIADIVDAATRHADVDALRTIAREQVGLEVARDAPLREAVVADLRALELLRAPSGARIAAPDFDPFYTSSGGYGYTWFRDDAEIAAGLLEVAEELGFDLDEPLERSARFYCDAQWADGSWPHRVWATDGSAAPGWAHARVEGSGEPEYQADQTASVVAFLARLLTSRGETLGEPELESVHTSVEAGLDELDTTLGSDGLPEACQNAWEDASGRFLHTAAKYLEAYATVAAAPVGDDLRQRAREGARAVVAGLDDLWSEDRGCFGLRLVDGTLDDRLDSASFALVDAVAAYAVIADVPPELLDRLVGHVETALDELFRDPAGSDLAGLVRYEGDEWRRAGQDAEKVWSVATAWGAYAAAGLASLLEDADRDGDRFATRAADLHELVLPDGPFCTETGFLAEQVFDDGTPDSAVPLGWSHALRLRTTARLRRLEALPTAEVTPAGPESRPRWTTGEKYGVGTVADHAADDPSRVWFTLAEGALTELRFPRIDLMNLRTLDFLVVDAAPGAAYTARTHNETRRDDDVDTVERRVVPTAEDALCFRHVIEETGSGEGHEWRLTVEYATDPDHDALLADVGFEARDDNAYEVYAVADVALTNTGTTDRGLRLGRDGEYHLAARVADAFDVQAEEPRFTDASGDPYSVAAAMTTTDRFEWATAGIAGSDRLAELFGDGRAPEPIEQADDANVVLVGRVGTGTALDTELAVGFAEEADTIGALGEAEGALDRSFATVRAGYADSWETYLDDKPLPDSVADDADLAAQYRTSLMVLKAVEDKTFPGALIASPSVPWGDQVLADEPKGYGYNFVWSRDLYQSVTVFEAVGDLRTAHDALAYVYRYQQDEDGFIPQNTYVDGRTRWGGEQMDNISFPAVMAYQLAERGVGLDTAAYDYAAVRRSADYVARNGPRTAQERWEEESGYSPSSIAAEIAGLACAGRLAADRGAEGDALVWLAIADAWRERVEDWTVTRTGTDTLEPPYYVRVTREGDPDAGDRRTLANDGPTLDERAIVDAGFLELVRLGIKPADDPVIEHSVEVVDETIRVETPAGPAFYRYTGDGYGERERDVEGGPWRPDAPGRGRLWPIFTGERGEYELLAGTQTGPTAPENLLRTMAGFANSGRMLPEQVWDRERSSPYNWTFGEGTGSATPLAWSMAQFVRLAHGIDAGDPVETPRTLRERYRDGHRPAGPDLRVDTAFDGDHVLVRAETDGAAIAVKTPEETHYLEPAEGKSVVRCRLVHGENCIAVAAASETDLEAAGTTVERLTL